MRIFGTICAGCARALHIIALRRYSKEALPTYVRKNTKKYQTMDDDDDVNGGAEIDDNNHNTTTYNESPRQPLYRNHKCLVLIAICSLVIIIIVAVSVPLTKDTRSNTSNNQAEVIGSGVSTPFPTTTTYPSQAPSVSR